MQFKEGDVVRVKEGMYPNNDFLGEAIFHGQSIYFSPCVALERKDGEKGYAQNHWWNFEKKDLDSLELVTKQTIMNKLTSWAKRALSANDQKLYKAGLMDGEFKPTETGKDELMAMLWSEKQVKLVKRAEEIIAEEKEEKK